VIVAPPVVVADASVQTTAGSWQNPQTYGLPPVVTTALGVVPPQQGADDVFGDPFLAVSDLADALLEVVDPHADLPSVRGTPLEAYVSQRPFAITLPDIELADLPIEHPADASSEASLVEVLDRGAGHLFSYPGEGGSVFLYSHSSNWPWVVSPYARAFREIHRLNVGDRVYVTYDNRLFVYQVSSKETVPAGDLAVAQSAGDAEQLVLYTCWPPDDITERYVVRAVPAGEYRID
jgi:LPXTG-site transpeptidase (sortase) family protein